MMTKELPKRYTLEEDRLIRDAVEQAQGEAQPLDPVFEKLAQELGRTAVAINYRYYNVLKKRLPEHEEEPAFEFTPYTGEEKRTLRQYTSEDDERIWTAIQVAEEAGIPMSPVWLKLAEDLGRTPKAIEVRCTMLKKRHREDSEAEDDSDDDGDGGNIVSKLKALVKERDYYKSRYEGSEEKIKDYDRMAKELRHIRKLLDTLG